MPELSFEGRVAEEQEGDSPYGKNSMWKAQNSCSLSWAPAALPTAGLLTDP